MWRGYRSCHGLRSRPRWDANGNTPKSQTHKTFEWITPPHHHQTLSPSSPPSVITQTILSVLPTPFLLKRCVHVDMCCGRAHPHWSLHGVHVCHRHTSNGCWELHNKPWALWETKKWKLSVCVCEGVVLYDWTSFYSVWSYWRGNMLCKLCILIKLAELANWQVPCGRKVLNNYKQIISHSTYFPPKETELMHAENILLWYLTYHWSRLYRHLLARHACLSLWNGFCVLVFREIFHKMKVVWTDTFF